MSLRGILRGFGLKVGPTTPARFEGRIRELVAGHPSLDTIAQGLLAVRVALRREFDRFEKQVLAVARCDTRARLLMSVPGVGAIVSLTFAAAIDDPARFKSSKQVGFADWTFWNIPPCDGFRPVTRPSAPQSRSIAVRRSLLGAVE
jgi:transposase